jgi:Glycosyltransferase family 87
VRRERATWAAVAVAAVLFAFSFYALKRWLEQDQLSDVGLYTFYAGLMRGGAVPYRDFGFEYPPAAIPSVLLPAYMTWSYATSFAVLMGACGAGCIAAAESALRAVGAGVVRTWAALLAIGVSPLLIGSVFDTRFDLWPTLLAVGAVAAIVRKRPVVSGLLLGLGFAAKLWPGVLLPIAVVYFWRQRGRRPALAVIVAFLAVALACFLPFVVLAPHGVRAMFADQLDRPLQIESLGAAVLMAAQHLGMRPLATINSHGGQALAGRGAGLAGDLSTAFELVAVVGTWAVFARLRKPDEESIFLAAAAVVSALVAFDRVLSPQYLIWLVPIVLLVGGRTGIAAGALLFAALGLTQTWFPWNYSPLAYDHAVPWSWYLLSRDLALVAIAWVLVLELSRGEGFARRTAGWLAARRAAA